MAPVGCRAAWREGLALIGKSSDAVIPRRTTHYLLSMACWQKTTGIGLLRKRKIGPIVGPPDLRVRGSTAYLFRYFGAN